MVEITVKIDGFEKFDSALRQAPQKAVDEISKAIQKSILTLQSNAMKEAPVNKQGGGGNLRQNIKSRMQTRLRGLVEATAPYAVFVELGTRPHPIEVVNKKVLANKRTGQFFGKKVQHPGTRPNPFFQRAIQDSKNKINEFFATAIANVIKSLQ
jgi:HK97 gp10 family phage protein